MEIQTLRTRDLKPSSVGKSPKPSVLEFLICKLGTRPVSQGWCANYQSQTMLRAMVMLWPTEHP